MSGLDPDSINWFVPKVALILALEAELNAPADTNLSLIWAEADTIPALRADIATLIMSQKYLLQFEQKKIVIQL